MGKRKKSRFSSPEIWAINNVEGEKQLHNAKVFVKAKVSTLASEKPLSKQSTSKLCHILIDSGNRYRFLMSEVAFKNICPSNQILPNSRPLYLTTAGTERLRVLGQTQDPITFTFTNNKEKRSIKYSVCPFIVQDLSLSCIMSAFDMQQLQACLDMKHETFQIQVDDEVPLKIPTCNLPKANIEVSILHKTKIKGNHEAMIPVRLPPSSEKYSDVLIEGCPTFMHNAKLMMCASINTPDENGVTFVRMLNPHDHPITIPSRSIIGYANPFSDEPSADSLACLASKYYVMAVSKATGAQELAAEKVPTTAAELYKRIYDDLSLESNNELTEEQKKRAVYMFMRNRNVLSLSPSDIGTVKGVYLELDTGDHPPFKEPCLPLNPKMTLALKHQLDRWFAQKVARWSKSPWASSLRPVFRKNGGIRFACNFQRLNSITKQDARPICNLEDRLARLKGDSKQPNQYWTNIDLAEAFAAVPVRPSDIEKTAVTTPLGLIEFNRMCFGYSSAPAVWNKVTTMIETRLLEEHSSIAQSVLLYFDDACLAAVSFEDMLYKVETFLKVLQDFGLKIQLKKMAFCQKKLKWLGVVIDNGFITPDEDLVCEVRKFSSPTNAKELASLYGLLSYFRKFIFAFAKKTHNISELKRQAGPVTRRGKPVAIQWNDACEAEKRALIAELTSKPLLSPPDFSPGAHKFIVTTDASSRAIAAHLSQPMREKNKEGKEVVVERTIAFCSKKLNEQQRHWSSYKLELYAVVAAIQKWRYYLLGNPFLVRSDNYALKWLRSLKSTSNAPSIVFRWQRLLADYQFEIMWVSSSKIKAVDALSRRKFENGDTGNMGPILPRRDPIWGEDEFDEEVAATSMDDNFWGDVMRRRFQPPSLLHVVTRSKAKERRSSFADKTIPCSFKSEVDPPPSQDLVRQEEGPLPAKFLSEEETWSNLDWNYPINKSKNESLDIEVSYTSPCQWWLTELICKKSKYDKTITFLIECCLKQREWPENASDIEKCVLKVFGKSVEEAKNSFDREVQYQSRALTYYLNEMKNGNVTFKMKKFGTSHEILMIIKEINGQKRELMLIPYSMQKIMVENVHSAEGSFHLGIERSLMCCLNYFFFYELKKFLTDFIQKCRQCTDGKRKVNQFGPGLGRTSSIARPRLKHFSMDVVHFPLGLHGHQYLLSLIDLSTKWTEAFVLKSVSTRNLCRILENEVFPRYGENLLIFCDAAKYFVSKKLKEVAEIYKSRIHYTTSYHSQSNFVEYMHRYLNSLIRMKLIDKSLPPKHWISQVPSSLYTINHSPDLSGYSNFYRVTGQHSSTQCSSYFGMEPYNNDVVDLELLKTRDQPMLEDFYPQSSNDNIDVTLHEDSNRIILQNNNGTRELAKVGNGKYFAEVSFVNEDNFYQEMAQGKRDQLSEERHFINKSIYDKKKQPKFYVPIKGELIDFLQVQDEDSPNSRKLANYWKGPYNVKSIDSHGKTAIIEKVDLSTFQKIPKSERKVYLGSTRPTLMLEFYNRPRGAVSPPWLQKE